MRIPASTPDPYVFDFLELAEDARERHLERTLIDDIQSFLIELGAGFAFYGRQRSLLVGETVAKLALHRVYAPIAVSTWQADIPVELPPAEAADEVPEDLHELDEVRARLLDRVARRRSEIADSDAGRSAN